MRLLQQLYGYIRKLLGLDQYAVIQRGAAWFVFDSYVRVYLMPSISLSEHEARLKMLKLIDPSGVQG